MITLNKIKTTKNASNVIFITNKLTTLSLDKELETYFKKDFKKEPLQYLKATNGYIHVVNSTKQSAQQMRVHGFTCHKNLNAEKTVTVIGDKKEDLITFLEGFLLSNYQFLKYLKEKKKYKIEKINVLGNLSTEDLKELENIIASVNWARDMVNEPVSYLDAVRLAEEFQEKGAKGNYNVDVFEQTKIESLKMGGLLAVNQGSETPATFTTIEYKPKNAKNKKPYVLVGKGVVYDTGGLSLKPTANSMDFMKSDMGGAACMAATINAIALNKLPIHVIGLVPATDNRPGKNAYAPGDIVTMFDGTTVEVLNTDAEGRMVLADAIAYAGKFDPEFIINAATLTGASVRAIGVKTAVFMGNAKQKLMDKLEKSGQATHDRVVPFPFWDEWLEEMKSDIADLKNIGGPYAGMITAGKFLEHFTKHPFIHIDLSNAFLHAPQNYLSKGATGAGVRLLYHFFKELAD